LTQFLELRAKQRPAHVEPFQTSTARARPKFVVRQDREPAGEKLPKCPEGCVVGSFDTPILATLENESQQVGNLLL
jgi:hypothetical protein